MSAMRVVHRMRRGGRDALLKVGVVLVVLILIGMVAGHLFGFVFGLLFDVLGTLLAVAAVLGAAIGGLVLAAFVVLLFVAGVTRLLAGFVARRS